MLTGYKAGAVAAPAAGMGDLIMNPHTLMKLLLAVFIVGMAVGGYATSRLMAWTSPAPPTLASKASRTVQTQSQVRYTIEILKPRFQPLPEWSQGAWVWQAS